MSRLRKPRFYGLASASRNAPAPANRLTRTRTARSPQIVVEAETDFLPAACASRRDEGENTSTDSRSPAAGRSVSLNRPSSGVETMKLFTLDLLLTAPVVAVVVLAVQGVTTSCSSNASAFASG